MFNMEKLVKLRNKLVNVDVKLRNSYFGKRYFEAIKQRLVMAEVESVDYIKPSKGYLSGFDDFELLSIYERGKNNKGAACARIRNEFTVLYFDIEGKNNVPFILAGHPDLDTIKDTLVTQLWGTLYPKLVKTNNKDTLIIGYSHMLLPDILVNHEKTVSDIFLQKEDVQRFVDLISTGSIATVRNTTLEVQGLKYDYNFGRKIA